MPIVLKRETANRLLELIGRQPPVIPPRPARATPARVWTLVRCDSAEPAADSGEGAQCYPGTILEPVAGATAPNELGGAWLTVYGDDLAAAVPTAGATYACVLGGDFDPDPEGMDTDRRPRAFAPAGSAGSGPPGGYGWAAVVRVDSVASGNHTVYAQTVDAAGVFDDTGSSFDLVFGKGTSFPAGCYLLVVDAPGDGIAGLPILPASSTQPGFLTIGTQSVLGAKTWLSNATFVGTVTVNGGAHAIVTAMGGWSGGGTNVQLNVGGRVNSNELIVIPDGTDANESGPVKVGYNIGSGNPSASNPDYGGIAFGPAGSNIASFGGGPNGDGLLVVESHGTLALLGTKIYYGTGVSGASGVTGTSATGDTYTQGGLTAKVTAGTARTSLDVYSKGETDDAIDDALDAAGAPSSGGLFDLLASLQSQIDALTSNLAALQAAFDAHTANPDAHGDYLTQAEADGLYEPLA